MTASPRGEADCSLRPGGEGGAMRRMRASLTVSSHQIQRIGGMRACRPTPRIEHLVGRCAHTPPLATSNRKLSPHQSLRDSLSSRRSRLQPSPGGEGGATRRMRASLAVRTYEIQSNCTKSHLVGRCAHTPPSVTTYRKISPHQSLRDSFSSRRSRL